MKLPEKFQDFDYNYQKLDQFGAISQFATLSFIIHELVISSTYLYLLYGLQSIVVFF